MKNQTKKLESLKTNKMILLNNIHRLTKLALMVTLVLTLGLLTGCEDDDPDPVNSDAEVQRVFDLLSASSWNVSSVSVDDLDFTSTYAGLQLSFGEGTYTSVNGGAIFSSNGAWAFTDSSAEMIMLDGETALDVIEISETTLVIGLNWSENTIGTGRTESVSGTYVFSFSK